MQAEELKTLHHISFNPGKQFGKACFSRFVEDSFPIFCEASVLSPAMLLEFVVTSEAYVT